MSTHHKRQLSTRWLAVSAVAVLFAMVALGCGSGDSDTETAGGGGGESTDVSLMGDFTIPWVPQIPWVVAIEKGWYEEAGLNVDYKLPQGTDAPSRLLGAGAVDMAVTYTGDMLSSNEKGLESKVLMDIFDKLPGGVCFFEDSGIKTPKDLEGKTVAIYDYPQSHYHFKHFFESNDVDEDEVDIVSAGANATPLMVAGKVDAADAASPAECLDAEIKAGKPVNEFVFTREYGFPKTYFLELSANSDWLSQNEDAAESFVHVTQKAINWSEENQDQALQIFIDKYKDEIDPEVAERGFEVLKKSWCGETYACWSPDKPVGWIDPTVWQEQADFLAKGGLIESAADAKSVLTDNRFLDDQYLPGPGN
jgi:putative hydroxymethylpyrimidine transport system substrate-binding protein